MAGSDRQGRKKKGGPAADKKKGGADNKKKKSPVRKGTQAKAEPKKKSRGQRRQEQKKQQTRKKPLTAEELDRQMDDYMMRDEKTAGKKLDEDMESYWEQKKAKDEEADEGETGEGAGEATAT